MGRLVERDQLMGVALEMAELMVDSATPFGLRITKEVMEQAQAGMSLEAVVHIENRNQVLAAETKDAHAAMAAWAQQKKLEYRDE